MDRLSIPGFELIDKIGQGGMATVWKARQLSLDRIVAIKLLASRLASDPTDVERFRTECKSAAMLKHPGIVQVYDAIVHEGMCCLVMEHIAGYSLGDWIRRKAPLSEEDAILVAEHVARALDHAWRSASLIHCDIKPDNIMIDTDGTIKVADLGLAVTIGAMSSMAEADEIMGTPNYMSPEQITGQKTLDCRTDIYSLGATLYQMLTATMLFASPAKTT
jgi:eukaryotic-like serine/threonine-protein kinase